MPTQSHYRSPVDNIMIAGSCTGYGASCTYTFPIQHYLWLPHVHLLYNYIPSISSSSAKHLARVLRPPHCSDEPPATTRSSETSFGKFHHTKSAETPSAYVKVNLACKSSATSRRHCPLDERACGCITNPLLSVELVFLSSRMRGFRWVGILHETICTRW